VGAFREQFPIDDREPTPRQRQHAAVLALAQHLVGRLTRRPGEARQIILRERDHGAFVHSAECFRQLNDIPHDPRVGRDVMRVEHSR
jgi:hypothetical protein